MKKLLKLIKTDVLKAFTYYINSDIEIDDTKALAKELKAEGDTDTATILGGFIKAYNNDTEYKPATKKPAKKPAKGKRTKQTVSKQTSEYFAKGRMNLLDRCLDEVYEAYDYEVHKGYRLRVPHGASSYDEAKFLADYWHQACDLYAGESVELAARFTHGIRHQICFRVPEGAARTKLFKGIPTPKNIAELYE